MPEHDAITVEDGFVACRCGVTFSRDSTGECMALYRRHFAAEQAAEIGLPGLAEARQALKGGQR